MKNSINKRLKSFNAAPNHKRYSKRFIALSLALIAPTLLGLAVGSTVITDVSLAATTVANDVSTCKPTQSLTEGPYYLAGNFVKSNITDGQMGTKTKFTITVVDTKCNPISGARVDIWHANASGQYSGVDGNSGTYLRGTQTTDANGRVTFTTIYPGWYPGRTMHIHFKVWKDGKEVLTSQWFASDANNSKIYQSGAYAARGNQDTSLGMDRIYGELTSPKANTLKLTLGNLKSGKTITAKAQIVIN